MKYFTKIGKSIHLDSGNTETICEISVYDGTDIMICDSSYDHSIVLTKEQAIEALQEAIDWIKNGKKN